MHADNALALKQLKAKAHMQKRIGQEPRQQHVSSKPGRTPAKETAKGEKPQPATVQEGAEIISKTLRDQYSDATVRLVDDDRIVVTLFSDTFENDMSALLDVLSKGNLIPGFSDDSPLNYRWKIGSHRVGLSLAAQVYEA